MTLQQFSPHLYGGSLYGEDLLFMYRMMVKMVQVELAFAGKPCFAPWTDLPTSVVDSKWPVLRALLNPSEQKIAEDKLHIYRSQVAQLKAESFLARVQTLNRLGQIIEPMLHQNLHGFYREPNGCSKESVAQGYCDDLVPPETSPLNKHFWKIHGLIDHIVGLWLQAHGYKEIAIDCGGRDRCYQWQGTWVGKFPSVGKK